LSSKSPLLDFRFDLESGDVRVAFIGIEAHEFSSDFDVRKSVLHPVVDCSWTDFVSMANPRFGEKF
jgi:hypothetical protein